MLANINFNLKEQKNFNLISFELNGIIEPAELKTINPPRLEGHKGVILSGRGPIWLYCYLTHFYHSTLFVAVYDPRLNGAVIVESHSKKYIIGDILKLDVE